MDGEIAFYMFRCGKLQRSIGNLHRTTALATGRKAMRMQNQLVDKLENYNLTDAEYEDAFYHVRLDISKSMTEAHLLYQKMTGDVENDYPWRYFVKAVIFETFCGRNLWDDMRAIRTLVCYVSDEKIKKIVEGVMDTLLDINDNDSWEYVAIVNGCRQIQDRGEIGILDYIRRCRISNLSKYEKETIILWN